MKKSIVLLLVCALTIALMPVSAEKAPTLTGEWYASRYGAVITLTLNEDGTYSMASALTAEPAEGTWTVEGSLIYLDGEDTPSAFAVGDGLRWTDENLLFSRERPAPVYTPAEVIRKAERPAAASNMDLFQGYWVAQYAELNGETVLIDVLGFETDIYVEGKRAALGGELFGDVIADIRYSNSAYTCEAGGGKLTLAMQQDGFMRLTLVTDEKTTVLYLASVYLGMAE